MAGDRRDEQLRYSLLNNLNRLSEAEPGGWVSGSKLAIVARDAKRKGVDDEAHAEQLLADLVELRLVEEKPAQPTGGVAERELRHRFYKCTQLGWRLLMGQIDPIPGVGGRD